MSEPTDTELIQKYADKVKAGPYFRYLEVPRKLPGKKWEKIYPYIHPKSQYEFGWSTKPNAEGKYESWVRKPIGAGARMGYAFMTERVSRLTVVHTTRAQARRRAHKLYAKAMGDIQPTKREKRWDCSECSKRGAFYENDFICKSCRDRRDQ